VLFYPAGTTTATRVYGQLGDFTTNTANKGGLSADSLLLPGGVALDSNDNLYLSDSNNRVLFYPAGSTTATRVYGQGGVFTTGTANKGGLSADSISGPAHVALDGDDNLYVADTNNNRVLFYPNGSTTATRVWGQSGNFTTSIASVTADGLSVPRGAFPDGNGNLYVLDAGNNRVLKFVPPCGNGIPQPGEECDDGNVVPDDGCSATCTLEPCIAAPVPGCLVAEQAQLSVNEKKAGKEKLKLQWKKVTTPTTQGAFGDPVTGTARVALCIYGDGGTLVRGFVVDQGGQSCGEKPCWAVKGTKGYGYKDKTAASDGITKIGYGSGDAGKGKADAAGSNNVSKGQTALSTGVAAALAGNTQPTIQMVTSAGLCIGATMTEAKKDDGVQYQARKK
jgi:cysteine-rich repeat protein